PLVGGAGLRSPPLWPRACSSAPSAADARPLPREETTPPVMKMYRAMGLKLYRLPADSTSAELGLWIDRDVAPAATHSDGSPKPWLALVKTIRSSSFVICMLGAQTRGAVSPSLDPAIATAAPAARTGVQAAPAPVSASDRRARRFHRRAGPTARQARAPALPGHRRSAGRSSPDCGACP